MAARFTPLALVGWLLTMPSFSPAQPPLRELSGHTNAVYQATYSSSGRFIATASFDQTVRLWDAAKLTPVTTFEGHTGIVLTAQFSPDERLVASGALDNSIRLWEVPLPDPLAELASHPAGLEAMSVSADGTLLAYAGKDHKLVLWDVAQAKPRFEVSLPDVPVTAVVIRRDNQILAVAIESGTVALFACDQGTPKGTYGAHRGKLVATEFTPNNSFLLTVGTDGYLRRFPAAPQESRAFEPATAETVLASLDATGNRLLTVGADHSVVIWDVNQGKPALTLETASQPVSAATIAPNGSLAAIAGNDKTLRIFQTSDGKPTGELPAVPAKPTHLAFRPDGAQLLAALDDGRLLVIQVTDGAIVKTLAGHPGGAVGCNWSPDGKQIVSAGADQRVKKWDAESGTELSAIDPGKPLTAFALAAKGDRFAFATADQQIRVHSTGEQDPTLTLGGNSSNIRQIEFTPDGEQLLASDERGNVTVWDLKAGQPQQSFRESAQPLPRAAFRPDESLVLVTRDKGITVQKVSAQLVVPIADAAPTCAAVAGNSNEITIGTVRGTLQTFNINNGETAATFSGVEGPVQAVAYAPNGSHFAAAGDDQNVRLWRVNNRQLDRDVVIPRRAASLAFSPDSRKLLVAGNDRILRSYSTAGSNRSSPSAAKLTLTPAIQELTSLAGDILGIGLTADNTTAFSGSADGKIHSWKLSSPESIATLGGHSGQIYGLAFHPDGDKLVSVSSDKTVRLWSVSERKVIRTLATLDNILYGVGFLPDGASVVVAGANRILKRIEIETGRVLQSYEGSEETLYTVSVSRDGKLVAAAGTGLGPMRSIWVWPANASQPQLTLTMETDSIYKLAFNKAGTRLLAVGYNGKACLFDLASQKIIHEVHLPAVLYSGTFAPDEKHLLLATGSNTAIEVELPEGVR